MRVEINTKGNIVIKEITERAMEYIRKSLAAEYFSEEINGTIYVNPPYAKPKENLIEVMKDLFFFHRMECSPAFQCLLDAWRSEERRAAHAEAELKHQEESKNFLVRETEQLRKQAGQSEKLKELLRNGCKGCVHFRTNRFGDDINAYCCLIDIKPVRLDESPLSFRYGECRDGMQYMGTKYYPQENCKYLKEMER